MGLNHAALAWFVQVVLSMVAKDATGLASSIVYNVFWSKASEVAASVRHTRSANYSVYLQQ